MAGQNIAYVRVSSVLQNTDRQLADAGIEFDKTFTEKISARSMNNRPQLKLCVDYVREGDTLHVHSIDRLARNLSDLQGIVAELTAKGVTVRFHKENLAFTGDDNPMNKLLFQMLGAVAEFEVSLIRERQKEGIQAAKDRGVRIGRKPSLTLEQVEDIKVAVAKRYSKTELAGKYGVSRQTIYKCLQ